MFAWPLRSALHALKYRRDAAMALSLATVLARTWDRLRWPADFVIPVPLSAERHRSRGYNQAALLAQTFADRIGLDCESNLLRRVRDTRSQVGLTLSDRRVNVAGAFLSDPMEGAAAVLIDDVCTTGSTLEDCARALTGAGAREVRALTVARAYPPGMAEAVRGATEVETGARSSGGTPDCL